ncbi:MAG: nitroreductase family protein [Elusimicrobia bacterium]|nr:nitroreductase family protein [Elusimicrobiota bacterium]
MLLSDKLLERNDVLKTIKKRRSVRMFSDKAISEEDILTLLQAANQAPSAHNQQSWRFIIVRGERKSELVNFISSHSVNFPKPSSVLLRMASRTIQEAPVLIAIANSGELIKHGIELFKVNPVRDNGRFANKDGSITPPSATSDLYPRHLSGVFSNGVKKEISYDFFRTMEIQSSAAAVQNLLLAATSLGIGAVWLGILYIMKDEILQFLEEPKGEFMAVVPVGYPLKPMKGPYKRPLETLIKNLE